MRVKIILSFFTFFILFGLSARTLSAQKMALPVEMEQVGPGPTRPEAPMRSVFDLLTQEEASKITLELDFTTLLEHRKTNLYFPAALTTPDGRMFKVEVKPRGKYRRKTCELPPLKIKFSKKNLHAEGLDTLNEVKLVMPCSNDADGDELLVKEYLAYKMFEKVSEASTRARLVQITIKDNHMGKAQRPMFALLLEDEEELVSRLHGRSLEQYGVPADSLAADQAALVAMFEYMIGNTDWDVSMLRNVRLIQTKPFAPALVIPYDFDFSGLVGAPYATPSSESGLRSVRERFLMANGMKQDALKRAVTTLKDSRKDFTALCRSKHLSKRGSAHMIDYLDSFFKAVEQKDIAPSKMPAPID